MKTGANRLKDERSPYLQQHASNPVDWYPWGDEAFKAAQEQDKPVFLSIGYSTCHWCHVMEHESFTDEQVAALMNDAFINVKVDREERPDVDNVYMTVSQMLTGGGGWPLTIIMTPDRKPFYAATYIPRRSRYGATGMLELIPRVKELWQRSRDQLNGTGTEIVARLESAATATKAETLDKTTLDESYRMLRSRFDRENGGFGSAPKFPSPHTLLFLLRYWKRSGRREALTMVTKTLDAMRAGGIFDHVGYGFHRYSTDARWRVPHFEKMLYDQAMHILAHSEAYQATRIERYRRVAEEVAEYTLRDLHHPDGGFYSAEDADSEGEEGKFYLWTMKELRETIPDDEKAVTRTYNASDEGNYLDEATKQSTGENILYTADTQPINAMTDATRNRLLRQREKRPRPSLDDKVLTDWNGLMVAALAYASRALGNRQYLNEAERTAAFIQSNMWDGETLKHRLHGGDAAIEGFLDDYAFTAWSQLELYAATMKPEHLRTALTFTEQAIEKFWNREHGGFYFTEADTELPVRTMEFYDGAIPSGNSVMYSNLTRLARLTGRTDLEEKAVKLSERFSSDASRIPHGFTFFMSGLSMAIGPSKEVVVTGVKDRDSSEMLKAINSMYLPSTVTLLLDEETRSIAEYTKDMAPLDGKPTAYVCSGHMCETPTNDVVKMLELLSK